MNVWPGHPYPLSATWDGSGVNFALFSENATKVELCLFDAGEGNEQVACLPMPERTDQGLLEFTRRLIRFYKAHPVFRRRRWFQGRPIRGSSVSDIGWFAPDGQEMSEEHWQTGFARSLGVFLNGEGIASPGPRGERVTDDSFCLLLNAHHEPLPFTLPAPEWGRRWVKVLDTAEALPQETDRTYETGQEVPVEARSLAVLRRVG